jgi:5'-3' exonuclease
MADLVLIDLSSVAHPIWAMSGAEIDPDYVSTRVAARCRELADGHAHVVIARDGGGRQFRKDIDPTYKANRPERNEVLVYQIQVAAEALAQDGFPVWMQPGVEADDIIASAVTFALEMNAVTTVHIHSADKDLLQLVGPRVTCQSTKAGKDGQPLPIFDEAMVKEKFGVTPAQMRDYLTLVGDKADNITGVKGVGDVNARKLLAQFGSVEGIYKTLEAGPSLSGLSHTLQLAFSAFQPKWATTRALITLKTDLVLPFNEWFEDRRDRVSHSFEDMGSDQPGMLDMADQTATEIVVEEPPAPPELATIGRTGTLATQPPHPPASVVAFPQNGPPPVAVTGTGMPPAPAPTSPMPSQSNEKAIAKQQALAIPPAQAVQGVVVDFSKQLEPINLPQAQALATNLFHSKLYASHSTAQSILAVIIAGRDWGLTAAASLRATSCARS